jgi:hypothetical protein
MTGLLSAISVVELALEQMQRYQEEWQQGVELQLLFHKSLAESSKSSKRVQDIVTPYFGRICETTGHLGQVNTEDLEALHMRLIGAKRDLTQQQVQYPSSLYSEDDARVLRPKQTKWSARVNSMHRDVSQDGGTGGGNSAKTDDLANVGSILSKEAARPQKLDRGRPQRGLNQHSRDQQECELIAKILYDSGAVDMDLGQNDSTIWREDDCLVAGRVRNLLDKGNVRKDNDPPNLIGDVILKL